MSKPAIIPDLKATRPETIAAARGLIARIFAENRWSEDEQRRYLKMLGYDCGLETLSVEGVRDVVSDLENARMVVFREDKVR